MVADIFEDFEPTSKKTPSYVPVCFTDEGNWLKCFSASSFPSTRE